jgi:hypothetical protein
MGQIGWELFLYGGINLQGHGWKVMMDDQDTIYPIKYKEETMQAILENMSRMPDRIPEEFQSYYKRCVPATKGVLATDWSYYKGMLTAWKKAQYEIYRTAASDYKDIPKVDPNQSVLEFEDDDNRGNRL